MIAARSCVSGKARKNTDRDARYVITDVTRPPQRPLPNGEMKRCHDHATAGRFGSGGDCTASGKS